MTSNASSSDSTFSWLAGLRSAPWSALHFLSWGLAALLLLLYRGSVQALPVDEWSDWLGLAVLAWGSAWWLVLVCAWAWVMPQGLLDGPSVTSPWRGTVVALAGLALAALLLWVGVWGQATVYAAFGFFVVLVLIGVRATLIKLNLRHGLFIVAHDALEVGMWALWACLPWLLWEATGRAFDAQALKTLAGVPLVLAVVVLALAHVPQVLQARLRMLTLVLGLALGVAWLARPAVFGVWAQGVLGAPAQSLPVTLALTDAGCNALNTALERRVCWYDPQVRHATVRYVRMVSFKGDEVVLQFHPSLRSQCLEPKDLASTAWRRVALRKQEVISWGQSVRPAQQRGCAGLEQDEKA